MFISCINLLSMGIELNFYEHTEVWIIYRMISRKSDLRLLCSPSLRRPFVFESLELNQYFLLWNSLNLLHRGRTIFLITELVDHIGKHISRSLQQRLLEMKSIDIFLPVIVLIYTLYIYVDICVYLWFLKIWYRLDLLH